MDVGVEGLIVSIIMVATTFLLGSYIGVKYFNMDKDLAFLTAAGSSVCGAAAVLATEPVVKGEDYKSAIAVSTVVLFGTIASTLSFLRWVYLTWMEKLWVSISVELSMRLLKL